MKDRILFSPKRWKSYRLQVMLPQAQETLVLQAHSNPQIVEEMQAHLHEMVLSQAWPRLTTTRNSLF